MDVCATIIESKINYFPIQIFWMFFLIFFRNYIIFFMRKVTLSWQHLKRRITYGFMFDFVGNILKFNIFTIIDFNFFSPVKKKDSTTCMSETSQRRGEWDRSFWRWRIWLAYTTYSKAFTFYTCKILRPNFT